ncbi:MAG: KamA family radical SAM protein [Syntrophales bacterium]|nr:KamA family radical SAM protein [Syntrophales bacterium]
MDRNSLFLEPWKEIAAIHWNDWRWQFRHRLRGAARIDGFSGYNPLKRKALQGVSRAYPVSITPYYFSLIDRRDRNDPVLRQCFPDLREINFSLGGVDDPLEESSHMPVKGLIRRYIDRCLILTTTVCAVYCRHCNRKRLRKKSNKSMTVRPLMRPMLEYIGREKAIREVILSGGDPLTLSDQRLDAILKSLRAVRHVEVLRIGSRAPVVMPMRVTPELCETLRKYRPLWFNTQFNHPREITPEAARACEMLLEAGIPVSNQSVLLRGINDSYEVMRELLQGLQRISVRPYYLFHCDPVLGTDHFRVDIGKGLEIMEKLRHSVSGLCLPGYVVDMPGGKVKQPVHSPRMDDVEPCR